MKKSQFLSIPAWTFFLLVGLFSFGAAKLLWNFVGLPILESAYTNPEFPVVGKLLGGRDLHSFAHYKEYAETAMQAIYAGIFIFSITGSLGIYASTKPFSRNRLVISFVILFALSVFIRLPNIGKPLQHELNLAHSLIPIQLLLEEGFWHHLGGMPYTFPGEANRYIFNQGMTAISHTGVGYYLTFPPLAVQIPFFYFRMAGMYPEPFDLQNFALMLHALTSILALLLYVRVLDKHPQKFALAWWALLPVVISPVSLYFQANEYSPTSFWLPLFVVSMLVLLKTVQLINNGRPMIFWLSSWTICIFLATYADNHGAILAATAGCWALTRMRTNRQYILVFIASGLGSIAAVLLMYFQYSAIMKSSFIGVVLDTAGTRTFNWEQSPLALLKHYALGLWPFALAAIVVAFANGRKNNPASFPSGWIVIPMTVLIHHLVFYQWSTVHAFSVLKAIIPAGLLMAWLLGNSQLLVSDFSNIRRDLFSGLLAGGICLASIAQYHFANLSDAPDKNMRIAADMLKVSSPDETLFAIHVDDVPNVSEGYVLPQTTYYLKRNIQKVRTPEEAADWMTQHNRSRGRIFYFSENREVINSEPIMLPLSEAE